ncbi:uncharacterized protein E0L32_003367 [Thyridium curvatum]|uniref:Maf-like protein n=1 Tax=Thyridium curvatum TaxID=1093900 RepID=A0A507BIL3_9PEZI|nr:uncharacterized protein E0L32_003367 [Thyridium curvatum]TPX17249.1 hypothetical protein E0L32_003367 [Thyridium curvatum]
MADKKVPNEPPPEYTASPEKAALPIRQSAPIRRPPPPLDLPILNYIKSHRVILASASPRRRELLARVGLTGLEIRPSAKPENLSKAQYGPFEYVSATARQKCLDVYELALAAQEAAAGERDAAATKAEREAVAVPADPALVISADTVIVTRSGQVVEKPRSEADHLRMLKMLRDTRVHRVVTTVCALAPRADAAHPGYEMKSHTEETKVYFAADLADEAIESYVKTREGADKAGGYAVQGVAGLILVEKIEGNLDNVIGLPVRKCLQLCERVVYRQRKDGEEEDSEESEEE